MAGIMNFLSAPFFHKPASPEPYDAHWVVNVVYKLNTMTGSFLFLSSCVLFVREIINDHIHCFSEANGNPGVLSSKGFESYCYISSTFSLPRDQKGDLPDIHPGIGPIGTSKDNRDLIYHNYYMWIPYLLFIQSLTFFLPYLLHKFFQEGRLQLVLAELHNISPYPETRYNKVDDIATFFRDWYNHQTWWALKLFLCDISNFVVIILNIYFTDWYLGQEFMSFGPTSLNYISLLPAERKRDPFNLLFPKMTKCDIQMYGPSGTIQTFDSLCVLTINVFNEKLYLLLWFVFVILSCVAGIFALAEIVLLVCPPLRRHLLMAYVSPDRKDMKRKLTRILKMTQYGDWMMLYMIAVNLDRVQFTDVIDGLEYPDYNWNAEPTDQENARLRMFHEYRDENAQGQQQQIGQNNGPNSDVKIPKKRKSLLVQNQYVTPPQSAS